VKILSRLSSIVDVQKNNFLEIQDCRNNDRVIININNICSIELCGYRKYVVVLEE
jgi:hypothetical protein